MRTNIEIDDELMAEAMAAGPYKTKREAVEAGLTLVKRQAAYRALLQLEGKVQWGWPGDERLKRRPNWYRVDADGNALPDEAAAASVTQEPARGRR